MSNFIEDCLSGKATPSDVDKYVAAWHDGDSVLELREYLGLTPKQYELWLNDSTILDFIIPRKIILRS